MALSNLGGPEICGLVSISPKLGGHMYAGGTTGLPLLRRDGFASTDAGELPSALTTTPVTFRGQYLFVNSNAAAGELRAEVLREDGHVWTPYSKANCLPVRRDSTAVRLRWKGVDHLKGLSGKPVRFRFHLMRGQVYSFWVSSERSGASQGYVAAGARASPERPTPSAVRTQGVGQ